MQGDFRFAIKKKQVLQQAVTDDFANFQWAAYCGIVAVFGIAVSVAPLGFGDVWQFQPHAGLEAQCLYISRLVLFGVLVVWAILWFNSTRKELAIFRRIQVTEPPGSELAIILVALFLGLSMAFVDKPRLITAFFSIGLIVNIWTQQLCDAAFCNALENSPKGFVPEAMVHYWKERPQRGRIAYMAAFSCMAFAFAYIGSKRPYRSDGNPFLVAAYWLLIIDIVAGELVVRSWRRQRDMNINHPGASIAVSNEK